MQPTAFLQEDELNIARTQTLLLLLRVVVAIASTQAFAAECTIDTPPCIRKSESGAFIHYDRSAPMFGPQYFRVQGMLVWGSIALDRNNQPTSMTYELAKAHCAFHVGRLPDESEIRLLINQLGGVDYSPFLEGGSEIIPGLSKGVFATSTRHSSGRGPSVFHAKSGSVSPGAAGGSYNVLCVKEALPEDNAAPISDGLRDPRIDQIPSAEPRSALKEER